MEKFTLHKGVAVPLLHSNIDTDTIIPSYEMKKVSKHGLADGLFSAWRYSVPKHRVPNANFVLNQAAYRDASILMAGDNFGCGSSREHAAWALKEFGIRAIIAPSFGSIFFSNCVRNGILPIKLNAYSIETMADWVEKNPQINQPGIDLPAQTIALEDEQTFGFEISVADKEMLVNGLDSIALTLQHKKKIAAFRTQDQKLRPWIYLDT